LPNAFDIRQLTALYYGMTTWMDDMVGRLMEELDRSGLAENTIVVFLSDHGDNLGSHHLFNKETLMEESIRIPLIFHAPHLWSPGVNRRAVAQIIDVMPTLLDCCTIKVPPEIQGRSLRRAMAGPDAADNDALAFIETSGGQIGIRTPTHLYGMQLSADLRTVAESPRWFYDLRSDPYQVSNLAEADAQADLAAQLREQLVDWNRHTQWLQEADAL
jgi:arylsulfatase A-like enzyme